MAKEHFAHNTDIGQNFLRDANVAESIVRRAELDEGDRVLEIGPGDGMLTRAILAADVETLDAIELDRRLEPFLVPFEQDGRFTLHWGDAVSMSYAEIRPPTKITANLPYHITTPVLWRILEEFAGRGLIRVTVMLQREAADRITSAAGSRDSSPLGITIAAMGRAQIARRVPRGAFLPMPHVDSAVADIVLDKDNKSLPNDQVWRSMLRMSFAHRRKTLINNWTSAGVPRDLARDILTALDLPFTMRPEEVSLDLWLRLKEQFAAAR